MNRPDTRPGQHNGPDRIINVVLHERTRWVFEHLPPSCDRLLDAGCHDAAGTRAFSARTRWAVGIDVDVDALRRGQRRQPTVGLAAASGAALPFRDAVFDCVVFSEVIEHVPAALEAQCISELHRVLRPGGTLILTTPHYGRFWWLDPLMAKTHVRRLLNRIRARRIALKGHKHYRVAELRELLAESFEIEHVERPGQVLYPLAYWGHLLPFGIGRLPTLLGLWQRMMDIDYTHEYGDAAYNVCIVARAR